MSKSNTLGLLEVAMLVAEYNAPGSVSSDGRAGAAEFEVPDVLVAWVVLNYGIACPDQLQFNTRHR